MLTSEIPDVFAKAVADVTPSYDSTNDPDQEPITINLPERSGGQRRMPATTMRVCPRGCHIALAHRWETRCDRCGQTINSGAVGLRTHFADDRQPGCVDGHYGWQHQCGEVMPPTERIVDLMEAFDEPEIIGHVDRFGGQARRQANEAGADPDLAEWDAVIDLAHQWLNMQMLALHGEIADEQQQAASEVGRRLLDDLTEAQHALDNSVNPDDAVITGSDIEPSVQLDEDGDLLAWDYDPRSPYGEPIVITTRDLHEWRNHA
jgi:hypothetical protein